MAKTYWVDKKELKFNSDTRDKFGKMKGRLFEKALKLSEVKEEIEKLDLLEILKECSDSLPHYEKKKIKAKRLDSDVSKIEGDITVYDSLFRKILKKNLGVE